MGRNPRAKIGREPGRLRQFALWFKPSWRMTFDEYAGFYHGLNPKSREKLRRLSEAGKDEGKRFRYMARKYGKIYSTEDNIIDHRALVEGISRLNPPKGATLASYGAGNMHHECFLAKEFPNIGKIIGVEPLREMAKQVPRVALNILGSRGRKKVSVVPGTFEESPLKEKSVDLIICNESFHHVKDAKKALGHMLSRLKPGGGIIIVYRPEYRTHPPKPAEIAALMEMFGAKAVESRAMQADGKEPNNNIHLIVGRNGR